MKAPTRCIGYAFAALVLTALVSCRSVPPAPASAQEAPPPIVEAPATHPESAPSPIEKPAPVPEPLPPAVEKPIPIPEASPPPIAEPPAPVQEPAEIAGEEIETIEIEKEEVHAPEVQQEEVPFDPATISKEVFDTTKSDVQALIERLNSIIRDKDYESWVTFLGARYRAALSDTSFLERVSASAILRKQKISLRELRDYFIYVVVPSRANDRVDDIEFIGQNRVKAFTVDSKGRRLRLYDLEKKPTGWEIIN